MPEREKVKVTPEEIAKTLMKLVTKPYKQDEIFREEAAVGCPDLDQGTYNLECFCLGVFSGLVSAGTVLKPTVWGKFTERYAEQIHLHTRDVLQDRELLNVALDRIKLYMAVCDPSDQRQTVRGIEQLFSELCCGDPSNKTLQRIGGSIYLTRGDRSVELLKTFDVRLD